jgi:purine-binding chemotaxis protein CheW
MTALYLIVEIAGERVAIAAADVESVVEIEALTPVPGAAPHVLGLSALRSRVLTVIDSRIALGLPPVQDDGSRDAIIASIGGHPYAFCVDRVEDVVESAGVPEPVGTALGPGWARAAKGVVEVENSIFLLIEPSALIDGPEREAA